VNPHSVLTTDFITLDIETFLNHDNVHIPYLISAIDGGAEPRNYINSYLGGAGGGARYRVARAEPEPEPANLDQIELFNNFMIQLFSFFTSTRKTLIVYARAGRSGRAPEPIIYLDSMEF
jgi:hypothetical protein